MNRKFTSFILLYGVLFSSTLSLTSCADMVLREASVPLFDPVPWLDCTLRVGDTRAVVDLMPVYDVRFGLNISSLGLTDMERTAQIFLYRNGTQWCGPFLIDEQTFGADAPFCPLPEPVPPQSDTWAIEVILADGQRLYASQTTPTCVPVNEVVTSLGEPLQAWAPLQGTVTVSFDDPPGEANYYLIDLLLALDDSFGPRSFADAQIELVSHEHVPKGGSLFSDATYGPWLLDDRQFDGTSVSVVFHFSAMNSSALTEGAFTQAKLVSLTPEAAAWIRSWRLMYRSEELGPFAEPVTLEMNVEGGLGSFRMLCEDKLKVYW